MSAAPRRKRAARRPRVTRVVLAPDLGIATVTELKDALAAALAKGAPVAVDASAVARVDTAALQLLMAFTRAMQDAGAALEWRAPSEAFARSAGRLGLLAALGCGSVDGAA